MCFFRDHFMEGCFIFNRGCLIFKWGVTHGGHQFWWGRFLKEIVRWGVSPRRPPHYGKPCTAWFLYAKRFSFLFRCILGSFLTDLNLIQNFDIVTDCNTTYIGDSIVDLSWWIMQNEKRIFLLLLEFNDNS